MTAPYAGKSNGADAGRGAGTEKNPAPRSPLFADDPELKKARRVSGVKIITCAFLVAAVVLFFVIMAANSERAAGERKGRDSDRNANMSDPAKLRDELIAAAEAAKHARVQVIEKTVVSLDAFPTVVTSDSSRIIVIQPPAPAGHERTERPESLTNEEREAGRRYRDMKRESLLSKSAVNGFDNSSREGSGPASSPTREQLMMQMLENYANGENGDGVSGARAMSQETGPNDPNAWRHKLDFLTRDGAERAPRDYSPNIRTAPLAPMELKAGTVIPGLLLVGVNSDLPGTVVGQVSENVYDTATGRYLLIPQGTRIIGVYDSRITHGQKRVAIVWNRLIYPDGSSLDIAGSPGTDIAGYSGIKGRVDNHYGQLIAAALFTSVFTAAADIAAGDTYDSDSSKKSAKDVLVETTGTTIANVGARLAERALDIQPTIVIKPGSRFNVMVQQDVVFIQSWKN
jgi:type IV secretory pathway VirB10-like protein